MSARIITPPVLGEIWTTSFTSEVSLPLAVKLLVPLHVIVLAVLILRVIHDHAVFPPVERDCHEHMIPLLLGDALCFAIDIAGRDKRHETASVQELSYSLAPGAYHFTHVSLVPCAHVTSDCFPGLRHGQSPLDAPVPLL